MSADHNAVHWRHDGVRVVAGDRLDAPAAPAPEGVARIDPTRPAPSSR
jgi:hypothetical protein